MPLERDTWRKRGSAFVDLKDIKSKQNAIDDLQDVELMGRSISINKAEPRKKTYQSKNNNKNNKYLRNLFNY